MTNLILNVNREGYAVDQIDRTMTVGELISMLERYDEYTPVYFGNDKRGDDWYTFGGIREYEFYEYETDDDEEFEDEECEE